MDCAVNRIELVAFHFGEIEPAARAEIERHLASCGECLGAYFALKRSFETSEQKPPAGVKSRLREAVAREVERAKRPATWSWWQRPLALALATLALVFAAAVVDVVALSPYAAASDAGVALPRE